MADPGRNLRSALSRLDRQHCIDVSKITVNGTNWRTIKCPKNPNNSRFKHVPGISIVSDNYEKYALAIELLNEPFALAREYQDLYGDTSRSSRSPSRASSPTRSRSPSRSLPRVTPSSQIRRRLSRVTFDDEPGNVVEYRVASPTRSRTTTRVARSPRRSSINDPGDVSSDEGEY